MESRFLSSKLKPEIWDAKNELWLNSGKFQCSSAQQGDFPDLEKKLKNLHNQDPFWF